MEWSTQIPIPKTWFVFRNVYAFARYRPLLKGSPYSKPKKLYSQLCKRLGTHSDFWGDLKKEAVLESLISGYGDLKSVEEHLLKSFHRAGSVSHKLARLRLSLG